uniref:Cytochrome-b5 reductase n=1 Tax=Caenorhabditis japonica TaxID=281687 RepID=A0A8R1HTC4_CAEJA
MNNLSVNNGLFAKPTIGRSEYGRVKVALAPGKGFMDWLRLTTNKHLAKRNPDGVDHVELMKHNKSDDCWVHLFGVVYDVTKYLDFHPGGIPELLRGAGRDATPLFNQYHAWVNYESMLKACVVGPFVGDLAKLPPPLPPTTSDDPNKLGVPSSLSSLLGPSSSDNDFGSRIDTHANTVSIEHDDWKDLQMDNIILSLTPTFVKTSISTSGVENSEEFARLRILVHHFWKPAMEFEFEPTALLKNQQFELKIVDKRRVEVEFSDLNSVEEVLNRGKVKIQRRPGVSYHATRILAKIRVNHDTMLLKLEIPKDTVYRIPLGHHLSVKVRKGNAVLYRPYTPIRSTDPAHLDLMIKVYPDGICTPSLEKLKEGDSLEISDPIGDKNFSDWICNAQQLILLAAGSGITPMIDILERRIHENSVDDVYLLMFNKTEKDVQTGEDVPWKLSEWMKTYDQMDEEQNIVLKNILSSPEDDSLTSPHLTGRVSPALLNSIVRTSSGTKRAFICGPDGFIAAAKNALEEALGLSADDVHIFQG